MIHENENNEYTVDLLIDMKESINKQAELLKYLSDETDYYNKIAGKSGYINCQNDNKFSFELQKKQNNNVKISKFIENKIKLLCIHDIEEDYIETGVESSMMKIRFCKKCKINM